MENIKTMSLLLAIVGGLMIVNIVLGTINGSVQEKFDFKKLLFGILKAIINALCIIATCILADIFSQVLNTIEGISISAEIVSTIQIICVVVAWCVDLFKEVLDKIKSLKELKYIVYEDVNIDTRNYGENG